MKNWLNTLIKELWIKRRHIIAFWWRSFYARYLFIFWNNKDKKIKGMSILTAMRFKLLILKYWKKEISIEEIYSLLSQ